MPNRQIRLHMQKWAGFSRFELMIAVIVIGIIGGILLERLLTYQELAEKADMEFTISRFKSGLRLRMAHLLVTGRAQEFVRLANENPLDWLNAQPEGGMSAARFSNQQLATGNWTFDASTKTLTYWVKSGRHFMPDSSGQKRVRLKIVYVRTQPITGNSNIVDPSDSVALKLVEPYKWF
jgi:general secretion pathway protein G